MEGVTLPIPPKGFEYRLVKKSEFKCKDPSELTARQLATLKYREKNRDKIRDYRHKYYEKMKEEEENKISCNSSGLPNN